MTPKPLVIAGRAFSSRLLLGTGKFASNATMAHALEASGTEIVTVALRRADLDEFVECYKPGRTHERQPTWSEDNPDGRWRSFGYEDLQKRDKLNLDIFWLKDRSLEDSDNLPEPDVLAQEIAEDLQAALEQFAAVAAELKRS